MSQYRHFLSLDCETTAEPSFDHEHESMNGTAANVWHGRALRWSLPGELKERAQEELLSELADAFERVRAGTTIEWDGHNYVGRRNADARAAREEIDAYIEGLDESQFVSVWDAAEWFGSCDDDELGIRGDMDDDELDTLVARLEAEAIESGECDELEGAARYLRRRRDSARTRLAEAGWEPTHEIRVENAKGVSVERVMLVVDDDDEPASAYTAEEWTSETRADWCRLPDGTWRWRDAVSPGGEPGTVTVRALSKRAAA